MTDWPKIIQEAACPRMDLNLDLLRLGPIPELHDCDLGLLNFILFCCLGNKISCSDRHGVRLRTPDVCTPVCDTISQAGDCAGVCMWPDGDSPCLVPPAWAHNRLPRSVATTTQPCRKDVAEASLRCGFG